MSKSTAVTKLDEQLAAMAAKVAATEATQQEGIPQISTKHGRLTYNEQELPNSELECIVLAAITERSCYTGPYDPDVIDPPLCFALGEDAAHLTPHENVKEPVSTQCKGCPKAEFGTAAVGKGPACKTRKRLILLPIGAADSPESATHSDMAMLKVAPTSVKNWSKYASAVAAKGLPPFAVSTIVKNAPNDKTMFSQTFRPGEDPLLQRDVLPAIMARLDEATAAGSRPWTYEEE